MRPAIIPGLRYHNAPAAIDFLCTAFGFERHAVYADDTDPSIIHHAQLVLNGNMIMLGTAQPATPATAPYRWRTPHQAGGVTMSLYVVLPDPDAHYATAAANGADIIHPPHPNEGYPGRGYETRDPEGHVWTFGNFDPWDS